MDKRKIMNYPLTEIVTSTIKPITIKDKNNNLGATGSYLTSNGTTIEWVTNEIPNLQQVLVSTSQGSTAGDANYQPITNLSSIELNDGNEINSLLIQGSNNHTLQLNTPIDPIQGEVSKKKFSGNYLPIRLLENNITKTYYIPLFEPI
jgi:hypothetical protein